MNITDVYIADAILNNTLTLTEHEGRFGKYWVLNDSSGMIEVGLTRHEFDERIVNIKQKLGLYDDA